MFDYVEPGSEVTLLRADLAAVTGARAPDHELHGRFARWIDETDDFPCPGDQAALDLLAMDAALRSIEDGKREDVEPPSA